MQCKCVRSWLRFLFSHQAWFSLTSELNYTKKNTVLDDDRYWLSHCNPSVYFLLPFLVLIAISWERVEKNRFRSQSANVFLIRQGTKVHFSDILRRLQNLKKYLTFLWNYLVTAKQSERFYHKTEVA